MQRRWCQILVGVLAGVLGVVLTRYGIHIESTDSFIDLRDVPPILCGFFCAPLVGIVAGVTAALGRALLPLICGIGASTWASSALATLFATLFAVAARRWLWLGARPGCCSAALFAAIAEVVHMTTVFIFGLAEPMRAVAVVFSAIWGQCLGAAILAAIVSGFLKIRQLTRENLLAIGSAILLALVLTGTHIALSRTCSSAVDDRAQDAMTDAITELERIDNYSAVWGERVREYQIERLLHGWHFASRGYFLLVNSKVGSQLYDRVIAGGNDECQIGSIARDLGLHLNFPGNGKHCEGMVLGERVFVWRTPIGCLDNDLYLVVPVKMVMASRDLSVLVVCITLSLVFAFGSMLIVKIAKQGRDLEEFYKKDEERRHRDLDLARDIQLSALPLLLSEKPRTDKIDIYATMRPAREVGGDFYDCFQMDAKSMVIMVADVSGKGIPAAMFMMKAKGVIRAAVREWHDIAAAMKAANNALCENNKSEMFVTAWLGVLNRETGVLEYTSAGHNPPMLRRQDGTVEKVVGPRALVLGSIENIHYRLNTLKLAPGDLLFLYTDGVTEATSTTEELFGDDRLISAIASCNGSAEATANTVLKAVDNFALGAPQADDITAFVLRYCNDSAV